MLRPLYKKNYLPYATLIAVSIVSTFVLWLPFLLKAPSINGIVSSDINFETVEKHWDGPLYIVPAKTLYNKMDPIMVSSPLGLSSAYYAAHLPGYPITLKSLSPFLGYPKALLGSTLIFTALLVSFFYFFVSKLKLSKDPFLLSLVFLFITPRFFVVRSVGSPEPMFILFVLMSMYFFIEKKYFWAGILGGLATITKTPGILLFVGYSSLFFTDFFKTKKFKTSWLWIGLIPLALSGVFAFYARQLQDFWAYFHSGDNIHLIFPPFTVFNFQKEWVGTAWLEDILFVFFFYILAFLNLIPISKESVSELPERVKYAFAAFMGVFIIAIISVQHRDISRYSLPLLPFALISFEKFFTSKKFVIALIVLLPVIYFYAWNFMLTNTAPIADWSPFL